MESHIKVVAALRIGFSILGLIVAVVLFFALHVAGNIAEDEQANMILSIIANVMIVVFTILSLPGILAGIGLLKHKEWARILTIILSVLDLVNFPLGTALGIYSIWVLAQKETLEIFQNSSQNQ